MNEKIFGKLFLSIGAMKAGTTWLFAVLERNPALHFTLEKEIHYFYHKYVNGRHLSERRRLQTAKDRYLFRFDPERANIDRIRGNLHWVANYLQRPVDDFWYRNLFDLRDTQEWACDFSNLHSFVPAKAWPQIADSCEQLRVLYTMRHPVKRLWSHTKFHLQMTGGLHHLEEWGPREFENFVRTPHIWNNAEYGAVLRRMREGLKPDQRKVIFYEDLHADQRGTLASIEDFLGITHFNYPQPLLERRFTESVNHSMPDYFPGLFADDIDRIKREIEAEGFKLPANWQG
ncbi:Sulfotransferase domain protein [Roseovarius sp. THAF9]|uniref:sulfotransferase n=1 Tax=Roseovarius sp. THAF9 TaxID=2587847 RepID=UPI0012681650|nr:sulfotransferase [Roseovarius sp. THAF9]QFT94708.1 Sulfotransferase domain protein [Roseovarius sp. THAF9]